MQPALLLRLGGALAGALLAVPALFAQDGPAVAARVNGEAIATIRLERALEAYMAQNEFESARALDPKDQETIKRQVLDVLIGRELLWQDAQAQGAVASDQEVAETMARLARRYESESAFETKLREGGWTRDTYAEELKHRLSVHRLVNEHLSKTIEVTDEEVAVFYQDNLDRFQRPAEVHARHILLKLQPDAPAAEEQAVRQRIAALEQRLAAGADFAELAKAASEGPSAPGGGDLGFFGPGRMVPPFEQAAFALQPGQVSGPVRTQFGYHLIKLEERRGGGPAPLDEVSDAIRQHLYGLEQQQLANTRARDLREAAEIEMLLDLGAATQ